jgi:hypothetical protein
VYAIHIEVVPAEWEIPLIEIAELAVEVSRVSGCALEHFYEPAQPHRGCVGVLFVSAASAGEAGQGVVSAARSLIAEPRDRVRIALRPPSPGAALMCHGVVSVPARI